MIRKEKYPVEQILPLIKPGARAFLGEDVVGIGSIRMLNFKHHGIICVRCGVVGSFFAKEKHSPRDGSYHLDLYAIRADGNEVLMTRDHIIAKADGGSDNLENMQTMCVKCNNLKGSGFLSRQEIRIKARHSQLRKNVASLRDEIQRAKATPEELLELLNSVIKSVNKISCRSITSDALDNSEIEEIEKFDTFHTKFVDVGNNVKIVHNVEQNERCDNFYIYNKNTRERLHIHITDKGDVDD
jgi:hypothetical protein